MNKIIVIVLSAFLGIMTNCISKDSHKNNIMKKINTINLQDKDGVDDYNWVYISGDSVINLDKTLQGLQNMKEAYQRFLDDSNGVQDGELIAEVVDMEIASELIALAMQQKGLKRLKENELYNVLKTVFRIDLNQHNNNCRSWKKENSLVFFSDDSSHSLDTFIPSIWNQTYNSIDLVHNIVFYDHFFYFYNADSDLSEIYDRKNNVFKIKVWNKDFHRSMFLFNDNKQSMAWLMENDVVFLQRLLLNNGFTKNNLINGIVLNEVFKKTRDNEDFEKDQLVGCFAQKYCDNTLEIREKLMQYIDEVTTAEDNDLLLMLDDYATEIVSFDNSSSDELRKGFSQEQIYKIFAYAAYYSYKGFVKYDKGLGRFSSTRENWPNFCALTTVGQNADVQEALRANKYYDIPGLKEAVEHIEQLAALSDEY